MDKTPTQTRAPSMAEQTGFVVKVTGGCRCKTCGQEFRMVDGSVMRSHAKRVHGVVVAVPARCDA